MGSTMEKGKVRHFRSSEMKFVPYGGPPGMATIARLVGPDISATLGAGIASFDGCAVEWTVLYDEVIVVLDGVFRLRLGPDLAENLEAKPGDVIWLPENTHLSYEGEGARVFYALYPGDWKKRHAL